MWIVFFTLITYHFTYYSAYFVVLMMFVYIVALSMPCLILKTLDVRVGTKGGGMRLYDGLLGNAAFAVLIIVLITMAVAIYMDIDTFGYTAALAIVIAVMTIVSSVYYMDYERNTVSAIERDRRTTCSNSRSPRSIGWTTGYPGPPAGTDVGNNGC